MALRMVRVLSAQLRHGNMTKELPKIVGSTDFGVQGCEGQKPFSGGSRICGLGKWTRTPRQVTRHCCQGLEYAPKRYHTYCTRHHPGQD